MMGTTVTLSLISHTNVGKTTLARTLLREDVGEVLDRAHVTDASTAYVLIEAGGDVLRLWDTPGFGDTTRLIRRLRKEHRPLGWFLHQVWDRLLDRPLWCSQQAVRNVKNEADVVLYLVNAAEDPEDAGYVAAELELLGWIGRPVLLLLNQVGSAERGLEQRWTGFVAGSPVVRGVLSLDAFARCWTEEGRLLRRVGEALDGEQAAAMERLAAAWSERNLAVFGSSCDELARYVATAALDRETPGRSAETADGALGTLKEALKFGAVDKRRAMAALNERLDRSTQQLMRGMIEANGLFGDSEARIEQRLQDFQISNAIPINESSGAVAGAVVSGALGGLAADALSGGLTLGGGMIAGGILGALGGSVLARGYRMVAGGGEPSVRWTREFLDRLLRQALLRYLAVAHFGRGRGQYRDLELPEHWSAAVDAALGRERGAVAEAWRLAEQGSAGQAETELRRIIDGTLRSILREAYPEAPLI
jgi:hypothetical protein